MTKRFLSIILALILCIGSSTLVSAAPYISDISIVESVDTDFKTVSIGSTALSASTSSSKGSTTSAFLNNPIIQFIIRIFRKLFNRNPKPVEKTIESVKIIHADNSGTFYTGGHMEELKTYNLQLRITYSDGSSIKLNKNDFCIEELIYNPSINSFRVIVTFYDSYTGKECEDEAIIKSAVKYNLQNDGTYEITEYVSGNDCVFIPRTVNGKLVTRIADKAFLGCTSLYNIILPGSIKSVGINAFTACANLVRIDLPGGITKIEDYTFAGCSNLDTVIIPDSVTSIGKGAFDSCISLEELRLPMNLTAIEGGAFSGCTNLENITIPNGVTAIEPITFSGCTSLKNITLPNSVTSIGSRAFYGCTALAKVTLPYSLETIEDRAFYGCSSLTTVEYNGTIHQWNSIAVSYDNDSLNEASLVLI